MLKEKFEQKKGITLIALIITIVVLLILAGVTLNIVLNSGIINKSQTAVSKYNEQAAKEKLTLALTEYKFKQLSGETPDLGVIISNIGGELTGGTDNADTEWTIDLDGYTFTVDKKTNEIKSIEPSNAEPLTAPEIVVSPVTYSNGNTTAIIEVTATAKNGGTISVKIGNENMTLSGEKYTASVTANNTYTITVTETVGTRTKTATETVSVTGIAVPKYTVTLTNPSGSGITKVEGGGEVEQGQSITITATVEDGKVFTGWTVTSGNASDIADPKANPTTVTPTGDITISASAAVAMTAPTAETGYVGCYVDFDTRTPEVDGIIYADLLVRKPTGNWGSNDYGTYTLPTDVTSENVKSYVVSSTPVVSDKFDSTARYVVSLASGDQSSKKDRFYVMGLNDITGTEGTNPVTTLTTLYWYKNAYSKMDASDTLVDFGKGKDNTTTILAKSEAGNTVYGAQDNRDLWKWIKVKTGETNAGWFVPSRGEWAAFAKAFNISSTSTDATYYGNYKLSSYYWSSSQYDTGSAWHVGFGSGRMSGNNVGSTDYVRLSATF